MRIFVVCVFLLDVEQFTSLVGAITSYRSHPIAYWTDAFLKEVRVITNLRNKITQILD